MTIQNIDPAEIARFSEQAAHWWDTAGDFKALHDLNPLRVTHINQKAPLAGKKIIDIGCGGGILAESMAKLGSDVTGIDMSNAALKVAKLHQHESGTQVNYRLITAEEIAEEHPGQYDVVTCLEMLEHVPDPASIITAAAKLARPDGDLFFSTLNRNMKSWLFAIVGAEYVLKLLPRNTHDFAKFIRPSELAGWARKAGLCVIGMVGIHYDPLLKEYSLTEDVSVNYMVHLKKIS